MKVSRATVVAEPGPLAEDIAERRAREGAKRGEPIEEPPVGRKNPSDLRLPHHYLAEEDAVESARVPAGVEFGDSTETSELEQAKTDQAFLEGRILTLEQMVKNAQIIDEKAKHETVEIGSHVIVEAEGSKEQYVIVGSAEAAPAEGRISNESPVGKALMGHRAGETVRLVVPAGAVEMKILTVR